MLQCGQATQLGLSSKSGETDFYNQNQNKLLQTTVANKQIQLIQGKLAIGSRSKGYISTQELEKHNVGYCCLCNI